ncbi:MAG: patatin-like phospholipase family protein [Acetobacteraceae bacterium]
MGIPPRAADDRLALMHPEVAPDNPDARCFELGLVLGGTVSAGAYTAGALDFLLEALERWHAQPKPLHKVVIKTAAGSSGGAVCAAILGLLSSHMATHVRADTAAPGGPPPRTGNPLWDLWVNDFQITRLLAQTDLAADADSGTGARLPSVQHVPSLLNCDMIDESGKRLADLGRSPGQRLACFPAPFRVAVTFANLRGIPYKILEIPEFKDFTGAAYVQHDDFAWFAFPNGASPDVGPGSIGKCEDEFWLGDERPGGFVDYATLVAYATASGAMPVGLAARALSRPAEHYLYRPLVRAVTDSPKGYRVDWPDPDWSGLPDAIEGEYFCTAVDGGTFNNDPVSLVHQALAGLVGQNPRGKSDARRAVLMIDPLADKPRPIDRTGKSMLAVIESIIGTVVGGARYLTADMELFAREDVFSRFQLVPFRPEAGKVGTTALAGTSLYAAGGWCARRFRVHDFLLGRWNMRVYLERELVLAGDNPLFDGWGLGDRQDWAMGESGDRVGITDATDAKSYYLPVVPVVRDGAVPMPDVPPWPKGAVNPAALQAPLRQRLDAVLKQVVRDNGGGGLLPWFVGMFAVPGVVDFVVSKVVSEFDKELVDAGLWPADPGSVQATGLS